MKAPRQPARSSNEVTKVLCSACGKIELLVGADGSVYDPLVGVECWPVENVPVDAAGNPLIRCWQCLDELIQGAFRQGVRFRFLEPIALPNGDILYEILPPVHERTEAERAELKRLGILEVLAGYQRGDPAAIARMGSRDFDHLPDIAPRPATPKEVAEEAARSKDKPGPRSPRSKGA